MVDAGCRIGGSDGTLVAMTASLLLVVRRHVDYMRASSAVCMPVA